MNYITITIIIRIKIFLKTQNRAPKIHVNGSKQCSLSQMIKIPTSMILLYRIIIILINQKKTSLKGQNRAQKISATGTKMRNPLEMIEIPMTISHCLTLITINQTKTVNKAPKIVVIRRRSSTL